GAVDGTETGGAGASRAPTPTLPRLRGREPKLRRRYEPSPACEGGKRATERWRGLAHRRRYGREAGGTGPAAGFRRGGAGAGMGSCAGGARLDRAGVAPGGDGLRRGRDRRAARRAQRPLRDARAERRTEPRQARGIADRAQFLLGRYPRGADPGGLAIGLAFGIALG